MKFNHIEFTPATTKNTSFRLPSKTVAHAIEGVDGKLRNEYRSLTFQKLDDPNFWKNLTRIGVLFSRSGLKMWARTFGDVDPDAEGYRILELVVPDEEFGENDYGDVIVPIGCSDGRGSTYEILIDRGLTPSESKVLAALNVAYDTPTRFSNLVLGYFPDDEEAQALWAEISLGENPKEWPVVNWLHQQNVLLV